MTMTDPKQDVRDVRAQFEAWHDAKWPEPKDGDPYHWKVEWNAARKKRLEAYQAALQSPAVRELVEAAKASVAEIERLRDAMFRVYSTAANGGKTTKAIEAMRDEMDKPWSVDRSLTALRTLGAGHE